MNNRMSAFYIWNPCIATNKQNQLEFVLINGDVSGIALDKPFAQHLLKDIGIEAEIQQWEAKPYRSLYYSEYLGEGNWRDDWPIIWKVKIEMKEPIQSELSQRSVPWLPTNATGDVWKELVKGEVVGCLVVSDFKDSALLQKTIARLKEDSRIEDFEHRHHTDSLNFSQSRVLNKYEQLQIDLGQFPDAFFAEGARYAQYVMHICQQQGGSIHHETPPD